MIRRCAVFVCLIPAVLVSGCDSGGSSPTEPERGVFFTADRAAGTNSVTLRSVGTAEDVLDLEIFANDVENVQTFLVGVSYPTDLLRFDGYQNGDFLEPSIPLVVTAFGIILITQPRITLTGSSGSGTIGVLQFTALEQGAGRIEFVDPELLDPAGDPIAGVDWIDGDVRILR